MLELENSNNARKALEADLHTGFRVPPDVAGRTKHGTSVTVTFEYLRPLALFIARAPEDLPRPRGLATSVQDLRDSGIGPAHILDLFVAGGRRSTGPRRRAPGRRGEPSPALRDGAVRHRRADGTGGPLVSSHPESLAKLVGDVLPPHRDAVGR